MNRKEYFDEICKIVSKALAQVGKVDAFELLQNNDDVVSHPWLDDRNMCLQILDVTPSWEAYLYEIENGCVQLEDDALNVTEFLENLACSAMLEDCREIIERLNDEDASLAAAQANLEKAAMDLEGLDQRITTTCASFMEEVEAREKEKVDKRARLAMAMQEDEECSCNYCEDEKEAIQNEVSQEACDSCGTTNKPEGDPLCPACEEDAPAPEPEEELDEESREALNRVLEKND